jgi:hypothetical protein
MLNRPPSLREREARDWLCKNATGHLDWSIPAWRVIPQPNGRRGMVIRTLALVEFGDEADATLFAIWAGGKLQ